MQALRLRLGVARSELFPPTPAVEDSARFAEKDIRFLEDALSGDPALAWAHRAPGYLLEVFDQADSHVARLEAELRSRRAPGGAAPRGGGPYVLLPMPGGGGPPPRGASSRRKNHPESPSHADPEGAFDPT